MKMIDIDIGFNSLGAFAKRPSHLKGCYEGPNLVISREYDHLNRRSQN